MTDFTFEKTKEFIPLPENGDGSAESVEMWIIGSLLSNPAKMELIAHLVEAKHFGQFVHAAIFERLLEQHAAGQPHDAFLIMQWLTQAAPAWHESWTPERATAYGAGLLRFVTPAATLLSYAVALRENWLRRYIRRSAENAIGTTDLVRVPITETIAKLASDLDRATSESTIKRPTRLYDAASAVITASFDAQRSGKTPFVRVGIREVDELLGGGLLPENLIIVGARPSMGKSALGFQMCLNLALRGMPVFAWSGEMGDSAIGTRMLSWLAEVPHWKITKGICNPSEADRLLQAQRTLAGVPFEIDDRGGLTVQQILAGADAFLRERGSMGALLVDHLNIVKLDLKNGVTFGLGQVTGMLKQWAKRTKVPVICLSQLSRKSEDREDKAPRIADLRDSGAIEQDADVVMFVHRPELSMPKSEPVKRPSEKQEAFDTRRNDWEEQLQVWKGRAQIYTDKNRHHTPGATELRFNGETTSFSGAWNEKPGEQ